MENTDIQGLAESRKIENTPGMSLICNPSWGTPLGQEPKHESTAAAVVLESASSLKPSAQCPSPCLTNLPPELIGHVSDLLPNKDVKALRMTCSKLSHSARLRFDRVFLSSMNLDISTFRHIADHEKFRKRVVEIVWDDTRMSTLPILDDLLIASPDILSQEARTLETNADREALVYGLRRFTALKRVIVTPTSLGLNMRPTKNVLRNLLILGVGYFSCGWPERPAGRYGRRVRSHPDLVPWAVASEVQKNKWRGFRVVTSVLAQESPHHGVTDLRFHVGSLLTGLDCSVFESSETSPSQAPCVEYNDFAALMGRAGPGLRRLDLSVSTIKQETRGWAAFRSGLFRDALARATRLERFSLRGDMSRHHFTSQLPADTNYFVPLQEVFPVGKDILIDHWDVASGQRVSTGWSRLRHFKLTHFFVRVNDLVELLAAMPSTLRYVRLDNITVLNGTLQTLLDKMRERLLWADRPTRERPQLVFRLSARCELGGEFMWGDWHADKVLYDSEEKNPLNGNLLTYEVDMDDMSFEDFMGREDEEGLEYLEVDSEEDWDEDYY